MDEIIFKYLKNELGTEDQKRLSQWLAEDKRNQEILYNLEAHWHHDEQSLRSSKKNVWKRISPVFEKSKPHKRESSRQWLKIAAVLVLGLFIGYFLTSVETTFKKDMGENVRYLEKVSLPGQKISITLPDKSKVKLNAGSKLIAPEKFDEAYREVELTGEAYFDIKSDKDRPFIIRSGDLSVRVLGTSFNVRAYPEEEDFKIAVAHGKVAVTGKAPFNMILQKDEMAVYNQKTGHSLKTTFNHKSMFSWKDKTLYFEDANIDEIIRTLEKWYGVHFRMKTTLDEKKDFSGEYYNKPLQTVLDGLSYVYGFKYEIKDDEIIILN